MKVYYMANVPLSPDQYQNGQLIEDAFNAPSPPSSPSFQMPFGSFGNAVGTITNRASLDSINDIVNPSLSGGTFGSVLGLTEDILNNGQPVVSNEGQTTAVECECPPDMSESQPNNNNTVNTDDAAGRRVRLRPKPGGAGAIYCCSPILEQIKSTNGMLWPYQPVITYGQDVDYKSMELTHANQDIYAYHRTPSVKLTVDGEFSVQTQKEGLYAMACIHYLRVVTKMYFGDTDPNRGTPPPVLLFDAYGSYMFNSLPVIVTNFTIGLPKDVDYVPVDMRGDAQMYNLVGNWDPLTSNYLGSMENNEIAWLPAIFNIQVQLTVQNTPSRLRKFNLGSFRNGALLKQGGWV